MKYQVLVGTKTVLFEKLEDAKDEFMKHDRSIIWERKDITKRFTHKNQIVIANSFK